MALSRRLKRRLQNGFEPETVVRRVELSADHTSEFISSKVLAMDTRPERARGGESLIHASALDGMCPRSELIRYRHPSTIAYQYPRSADRVVWALGRAAEKHLRIQFINAVDKAGVVGKWECNCKQLHYTGEHDASRNVCVKCGTRADNYAEITLKSHRYNVSGNPDLIYINPSNGKYRVVEIKSMNKKDFDALSEQGSPAPKIDHVTQGSLYHRLLELAGYDVDTHITVMYVCKDYSFKGSPYLEVPVEVDDSIRSRITRLMAKAEAIKLIKDDSSLSLPPRQSVCNNSSTTKAKSCDDCTLCFSL